MTSLVKDRFFSISCVLEPTKEKFPLKNISNEMKIKDLKAYAEFATGIPSNLQRLCYLDQGKINIEAYTCISNYVNGKVV